MPQIIKHLTKPILHKNRAWSIITPMECRNDSRPAPVVPQIIKKPGQTPQAFVHAFLNLLVLRKAQGGRRRHKPCDPTLFTMTA